MRIAYLINQYPKVSHSFIRREIAALEMQGHEIIRFALRGWDLDLADEEDRAERARTRYVLRAGAPTLVMAVLRTAIALPVGFIRSLKTVWHLSRKAERPFAVHLVYLAEACLIERWLREAKVQHLHAHFGTNSAEVAMLVHCLSGLSWSFTVHGPEEFDKTTLIALAQKVRSCSFVVAVSSYGRSQLFRLVSQQYWHKIHVVHCGLAKDFLQNAKKSLPLQRRLVCIGRLNEQKGQLLLLEAAGRLKEGGIDFELVLVGDGEMRQEIDEFIRRRDLGTCVRVTGWMSGERVRDEILAARAVVLPSLAEGLPVVLMEAMALRRPVISTFVAGIPELVRTGENGWLVAAGDIESLMMAIKVCLDVPLDSLEKMGEAGRDRVLTDHDATREATKLAKLFEREIRPSIATIEH